MEPTGKERRLQETAQLLIYVRMNTKTGVKVDGKLQRAANDIYCSKDYVPELCDTLRSLSSEDFDRVVYNGREPMSRKLADWWEEHDEADRMRIAEEEQERVDTQLAQQALNKLSAEEKTALSRIKGLQLS
jgi:2-succinyl-5-enolpyruvyl-6-hydroxy-3-cyclohexene-1-carboxylate synthase